MRRASVFWLLAAAGLAAVPAARALAEPSVTKMALVTIQSSGLVSASPAKVWSALTDIARARQWCSYWPDEQGTGSLAKLGASLAFKDEYGNTGRSVVVFVADGKELRLVHAPDDGSYLCQTVFRLAGEGSGTRVTVVEQYSDQMDVPLDKDTAAGASRNLESNLAGLKKLAETAGTR